MNIVTGTFSYQYHSLGTLIVILAYHNNLLITHLRYIILQAQATSDTKGPSINHVELESGGGKGFGKNH